MATHSNGISALQLHLGGKSRALRIDEFAFECLREQHRPQFLAHLVEELGADPPDIAGR
jgi:hypothetical protein